jgi:PASTA domain
MRYELALSFVLSAALVAGGCGGTANRVPNVEGEQLDVAQERLDDAGLGYEVVDAVVRTRWRVCDQHPAPGKRAKSVELRVARSCPGLPSVTTVPHVTGLSLDEAKRRLDERGLNYDVEEEGLGEVLIDANWTVCDQWPYSGERSSSVELHVEHFCDYEEDDDDDDF